MVPGEPSITSITVTPDTVTATAGQTVQFTATVVAANMANQAVNWSVDEDALADGVTIDNNGKLVIPADATVETITVTANSVADNTKTAEATVTISTT